LGHIPVLRSKVVELLGVHPGGYYIDCTLGGGGHTRAICERGGKVVGIDIDPYAVTCAEESLKGCKEVVALVNDSFTNLRNITQQLSLPRVDGILFDLGLSSLQLEDEKRGFSFKLDSPLDMRFDVRQELTAEKILNTSSKDELYTILKQYGEEDRARKVASLICQSRPLNTTFDLVRVIQKAGKKRGRIHPATKVFQALRIAVNQELENLRIGLAEAEHILSPRGRLVVISYHSLEDRIVKNFIRSSLSLKPITPKPIRPDRTEVEENPRSRSAKLRVAERSEENP
jgi:16S rRNA (cytosine1402-N4)-methyltransferase